MCKFLKTLSVISIGLILLGTIAFAEDTRILKFGHHLQFGSVEIGNSVSKDLILYNKGNSPLHISRLRFYDRIKAVYDGDWNGTIEAGESQSISITFTPIDTKVYSGLVYIESDRTNTGDYSRLLKGKGIGISPITCSKILKFGPHLNFGKVKIGESTTRAITLYNRGTCPLTIEKFRFHDRIKDVFSGDFSGIIEAGASQEANITFTPTEKKRYRGLVYVHSDRTNNEEYSRMLIGEGEDNIDLTPIEKLSKASTKHTKSDWLEIENYIQALDNTEGFNTMLLGSINKNIVTLQSLGIDRNESYSIISNVMYDDLIKLDIEDLDNQVVAECNDDDTCKEEAYASLAIALNIDKEKAYALIEIYHGDIGKLTTMDKLLKDFTCEAGLVRKVQYYGVTDNFSTANGLEPADPNPTTALMPNLVNYNNLNSSNFAPYDIQQVNHLFLEDIKNLPTGIQSGRFYIGLKSIGELYGNDTMSIGNLTDTGTPSARYSNYLTALNGNGWTNMNNIYWNDFSNISFANGQTLKSYVQTHSRFDVLVQDDTSVDFITVATCSTPPTPIEEITAIVNEFECSEKETLVKILGGEIDAFALPEDPTTPSSALITSNTYAKMKYDDPSYDKHFIDTLDLGLASSQTVTKAQFHIGYKSTNRSIWTNDTLSLYGNYSVSGTGFKLYESSATNFISNTWGINTVNGETIASTDLDLNNTVGSGTVFGTMVNTGFLDIYLQDDTTVDFTQLNLCVKENCDEGAEDISLNLSQLASWTTSATDAVNNSNPIPTVWDNSLNWIEFTSKETNGHRVLEIPFCACSNALIDIKSLKADNLATVKLDNNTTIVTQNAPGQASMKADSNGGVHASGSYTITNTTSGPTNHVLRVDVHNQSLWFGVGIEGTLKFKGNLGRCKWEVTLPVEDSLSTK